MRKSLGILVAFLMVVPVLSASVRGEPPAPSIPARDTVYGPGLPWAGQPPASPVATGHRAVVLPPPESQAAIGKIVKSVSNEYVLDYLTRLQGFGSRYCRAPGMFNATQWLHDALLGNGRITSEFHNFSYVNSSGATHTIRSVILTLPGLNASSDRVWYLMCHADDTLSFPQPTYDQLMNNAPGADDDGSGVAATLETARVLSRFGFQDTIRFAFFNGEEIGLLGSYYWAQRMYGQGENIQGFIDYDMIGYSTGPNPYDLDVGYMGSSVWVAQYLNDVNSRYKLGLSIYLDPNPPPASDFVSFYQFGYEGIMGIEDTFSPYYHTTGDRVEHMNTTLVTRCSKLAVAALSEMSRMLYVDVGVANLSASDTEPVEGERVNLTVNVTNAGNLNATGVEAAFYADGFQFDSKLLSVPANGTNTTASSWVAAPGRHRLSVVLDPGNELGDTDRSNNTADITVTVNDRPRAVLSATPLTVLTNESVLLNGSLSYDSSGIGRYLFDFGDGNGTGWTSSPTASHAYLENGAYQATLRVEDAQSAVSDAASVILTVLDRGPTAFPYSNVSRAMTFEAIRFASNATDSDGTITAYAWDFGDGSGSSEAEPVHNYSTSGAYTIGLMVTDNDGKTADASLHMIIDDRAPLVSIEVSDSRGTIETGFLLKANASDPDGTVAAWEWDLGDGATSNSKSVSHTFGRPGNYTVRLTVRDDSGSESRSTTTIHVIDTPPKAAAFVSTVETDTFKRVQFTGDESSDLEGPITFSWDFGDGNTSSEPSPYHAYARPGYYNSTLTVRDSAGQNDTVALPAIDVANRRPTAQFRFFGCFTQNGTVIFDGSGSSDPEGPVSWSWDFGDGRSAAGAVAEHIFPAAGNYTINLTVTDLDGGTNSATAVVSVLAPPSPPSVKRKPAPEDKTSTVNILLVVVVLLIVLLAVVALWGASRVRKPGLENTPMQGPLPPDGPPPGPSMQTAFKEFSPSEEQLKGAPRH